MIKVKKDVTDEYYEIKELLDNLNKYINDKEEITKYGWCEISVKNAKLLLDYITNLQERNKKYEKFVNELRKIVNGELVPRYHTTSERAKIHFNEGWSLLKSFIKDRMEKL